MGAACRTPLESPGASPAHPSCPQGARDHAMIESVLPPWGEVYVFQFTDRQYENIVRFSDQRRRRQQKNPEQMALF